jgi:hypothetical protein
VKTSARILRSGLFAFLLAGAVGMKICQAGTIDIELRVTPEVPRPFQPITVHALQDPCYRFGLNLTSSELLDGNVIRVVVPYSGVSCATPIPVVPFHWTIPGVPAGSYRLELMADSPGVPSYYLLDAIDIQVALGAAPQPAVVPSTSWVGLGALALLLAFAAQWSGYRRE